MAKRVVIDPISRIEGHLRIEVEVENGKVKDAWSSGTLFRGFEIILQGRDPRDAWFITQRICGVCPVSHGHTSTMGLEKSFNVTPPDNARIIRNLIEGGQFVHSHILWFYQLNALDYVDVVSALQAKPKEKSLQDVQAKLKKFVEGGQLGPFANGYWGHPEVQAAPGPQPPRRGPLPRGARDAEGCVRDRRPARREDADAHEHAPGRDNLHPHGRGGGQRHLAAEKAPALGGHSSSCPTSSRSRRITSSTRGSGRGWGTTSPGASSTTPRSTPRSGSSRAARSSTESSPRPTSTGRK